MTQEVKIPKGIWVTNGLLVGEILAIAAAFISIQSQIQTQSQRSDNLYKEFINLVKEVKK